jgi:hypothetical protein
MLRSFSMIAALGFAVVGCNSSQTTGSSSPGSNQVQKSPDEQFADLRLQYQALTDADKRGEKGKKLIAELTTLMGNLSEEARNEAGRVVASHKTLEAPLDGIQIGGPLPDPSKFPFDPNQLKFPDRKTVDGKLPFDPSKLPVFDPGKLPFDPSKFPFDPAKLPDPSKLPFPIDPSKLPKLPDGKLPAPPSFPDLKLPIDPGKFPELKVPDFPKIPDETLPPPREKPGS